MGAGQTSGSPYPVTGGWPTIVFLAKLGTTMPASFCRSDDSGGETQGPSTGARDDRFW
jgi:hypothetical protein